MEYHGVKVRCCKCGHSGRAKRDHIGMSVACPKCGQKNKVTESRCPLARVYRLVHESKRRLPADIESVTMQVTRYEIKTCRFMRAIEYGPEPALDTRVTVYCDSCGDSKKFRGDVTTEQQRQIRRGNARFQFLAITVASAATAILLMLARPNLFAPISVRVLSAGVFAISAFSLIVTVSMFRASKTPDGHGVVFEPKACVGERALSELEDGVNHSLVELEMKEPWFVFQ